MSTTLAKANHIYKMIELNDDESLNLTKLISITGDDSAYLLKQMKELINDQGSFINLETLDPQ